MEPEVRIELFKGGMSVSPCPDALKMQLCHKKAFKSKGRILRREERLWVESEDGAGIEAPRGFYKRVRCFLEVEGIDFSVTEHFEFPPSKVVRRDFQSISDRHFQALRKMVEDLDSGGSVLLHPEDEDLAPLIRGLIRLYRGRRVLVVTANKKQLKRILKAVKRYQRRPDEILKPLDYERFDVPRVAIIQEGELRWHFTDANRVDVFIMLNVDRLSGKGLQGVALNHRRCLKFGFASKTRNSFDDKRILIEGFIGPVAFDLRPTVDPLGTGAGTEEKT